MHVCTLCVINIFISLSLQPLGSFILILHKNIYAVLSCNHPCVLWDTLIYSFPCAILVPVTQLFSVLFSSPHPSQALGIIRLRLNRLFSASTCEREHGLFCLSLPGLFHLTECPSVLSIWELNWLIDHAVNASRKMCNGGERAGSGIVYISTHRSLRWTWKYRSTLLSPAITWTLPLFI